MPVFAKFLRTLPMTASGKYMPYTLPTFGTAFIDSHSVDLDLLLILFLFIVL